MVVSIISAEQAGPQYLINAKVFAGSPQSRDAVELVASPQLRTVAGREATLDLGEAPNGYRFHLGVTPSDLGAGRVGLRIVATTTVDRRETSAVFDLLTGGDKKAPTVVLRSSSGEFLKDKQGRPLFLEFGATVYPQ